MEGQFSYYLLNQIGVLYVRKSMYVLKCTRLLAWLRSYAAIEKDTSPPQHMVLRFIDAVRETHCLELLENSQPRLESVC